MTSRHTLPQEVSGTRLRIVRPDDADYFHGLRSTFNAHLSAVTGTARDQRLWINAHKTREAASVLTDKFVIF